MKTGNGLLKNFAKLSLDENDFTNWLDKKPLRWVLFMQVIRRASKNKNHQFGMSKTEYQKFGLTKSQAGQIERFLESLCDFNCIKKTGTFQEPNLLKSGTQTHYSGSTVYVLINNEFVDLSRDAKVAKQEPKKEKTGTFQEVSREEIYNTNKIHKEAFTEISFDQPYEKPGNTPLSSAPPPAGIVNRRTATWEEKKEMKQYLLKLLNRTMFEEAEAIERGQLQNHINLRNELGPQEYELRAKRLMQEEFHKKNMGSLSYALKKIKGHVPILKKPDQLVVVSSRSYED